MDNSFIFIIFFSAINFAEIILGIYHYKQMKKYNNLKRKIYDSTSYKSYGLLMDGGKGLYYKNQFVFYNCLFNGLTSAFIFLMVISRTFTEIFWCPQVLIFQIIFSIICLTITWIVTNK
jgi:hypothetical protein